jgi:AcrR family transcriptional regulator
VVKQPGKGLPRGRSALSADEVDRIHRERLCRATAEVMAKKGYAGTSVEDVLKRAHVSRRAFYQLFRSKLECFLAAFEGAQKILLERMLAGAGVDAVGQLNAADNPLDRFESALSAYLAALVEELPLARLFLVETYAAGAEAVRLRVKAQETIVNAMADLMGVTGKAGRSTCAMVIAAVSSMVTGLVAVGDRDGIQALCPSVVEQVRRLWNMGAFAEPPDASLADSGD